LGFQVPIGSLTGTTGNFFGKAGLDIIQPFSVIVQYHGMHISDSKCTNSGQLGRTTRSGLDCFVIPELYHNYRNREDRSRIMLGRSEY
jgi:hypothetical protein